MMHSRKNPRLKEYDYTEGNAVFVTVCVSNRRKLLGTIADPETECDLPRVVLSEIGTVVEQFTNSIPGIDQYVIMPNHVHMIVFNREGEHISQKIRSWKIVISKAIGESIWQRSFYDHVIRDEQDYLTKGRYIENNPSKWALDEYYQR